MTTVVQLLRSTASNIPEVLATWITPNLLSIMLIRRMQGYINLKSRPLQKPLVLQGFCWSYLEVLSKYKLNLKCFVYLHSTIFSLDFGNILELGHRSGPEFKVGGKLCKGIGNCFCFLKSSKNSKVLYLIICSKLFQKIFLSKYFDIFDKSSIFESEMYTEANMASCVCYNLRLSYTFMCFLDHLSHNRLQKFFFKYLLYFMIQISHQNENRIRPMLWKILQGMAVFFVSVCVLHD